MNIISKRSIICKTTYLIYETATHMPLAAGRLILADNRRFYPGRKWFYREQGSTTDKSKGFCESMEDFLDAPTIQSRHRIIEMIQSHKGYPIPPEGMNARIVKESTLNLEEW